MKSKNTILQDSEKRIIIELGTNIKLARQHRKLRLQEVAARANISRPTLWKIEKGTSTVSIRSYLHVLSVLGLEKDLVKVADERH